MGEHHEHHQDHGCEPDRIEVFHHVHPLRVDVHIHNEPCGTPAEADAQLHGQITAFTGKGQKSMTVNPTKLIDTDNVVCSVMPRNKDKTIDTAAAVTWASSDPSLVVTPQPGGVFDDSAVSGNGSVTLPAGFSALVETPGASGGGNITASCPGYQDEVFPITYTTGKPGSLNGSVGTPVPDAP